MRARILHRYNQANYWAELNPILKEGEMGIESDTGFVKIGDGVTNWNNLDYSSGEGQQYFFQSLAYVPRESDNKNHRGCFALVHTGTFDKKTDRAFMFLNKKVVKRNGQAVNEEAKCELTPISYFASIRDQQDEFLEGGS